MKQGGAEKDMGVAKRKKIFLTSACFHLSTVADAWRSLLLLSVLPCTSFLTSSKRLGRRTEDNKEVGGTKEPS